MVRIETYYGNGTGFIFETTAEGKALILTNHHVVEDAWTISVLVNDSDTYEATVRGYDAYRDLAVLEICCGDFPTLPMSAPAEIKAGTEVMAIGYPLGIAGSATVTKGIASAYRYNDNYRSWVIQTDASINPGNSGGPLITSNGEVIGINTFAIRGEYSIAAEGLGFAISQQSIHEVLSDMKQGAQYQISTPTPTLTPTPTRTPTPTPVAWRTYTNQTYRYTIEVPRDWKIDDSDKSLVLFDSPDQFAYATVDSVAWQANLDNWVEIHIDHYRSTHGTLFKVIRRDTEEFSDGSGAAFLVLIGKPAGFSCLESVTVLMRSLFTRSYSVTSGVCHHSFDQYLEISNSILFDKFSPY